MPLRLSIQTASAFAVSAVGVAADAIHSRYLRHQAIEALRTNNLALHVFHSQDCHADSFYRDQAYPIAGHYFDAGHRPHSTAQADLIVICPFKTMYETPSLHSAKIWTANLQVTWHKTATWPRLLNHVEVQFANEQTKPIVDYLKKVMKRETYTSCGSHAIKLSELARKKF